jgi:GH15 family glucan-1,4-alpha-glucosidase
MWPWHHESERSATQRRAPTNYEAAHVLLRLIRCVTGRVHVEMECIPMLDYGRAPAQWAYVGDGYHEAVARAEEGALQLRLTTDLRVGFEGTAATARTLLKEGDSRFVAVSWNDRAPPRTAEEASDLLRWTCHHWQHWLDRAVSRPSLARPPAAQRADTRGLSFGSTGAVSRPRPPVPETLGGVQLGLPLHLDP